MSKKSNWFVVATEGATTDGRKINREWLSQIAQNYDPKKYGARINLEHLKFRYMWKDDPHICKFFAKSDRLYSPHPTH